MKIINIFKTENLKGDLSGGISSALVSLPWNIIYGMIAFAPLGNAYSTQGIIAGFYCSIIVGFITSIFGDKSAMITGPKATTTLVFSSVIIYLKTTLNLNLSQPENVVLILTLTFFVVTLSGVFQLLFGLLKFGNLIKFIPYTVIVGFLNGTAVLIFIGQIWNFLGINQPDNYNDFIIHFQNIKILNIWLGIFLIALIILLSKKFKKLNQTLAGLIIGIIIFHFLTFAGLGNFLGSTLGIIKPKTPAPDYFFNFITLLPKKINLSILINLIPAAFSMAILGSVNTLLTASSLQNYTSKTPDSNKNFIGLGIGNIIGSFFGSIVGSGCISRTITNYQSGGTTKISSICNSLFVLLIFFILTPVISIIPKVVIASILFIVSIKMIDPWSIKLFKTILLKQTPYKGKLLIELLIVLSVMLITIFLNLIVAVIFGIFIAFIIFLMKMSKSIVRRIYRGNTIHSNKQRKEYFMEILNNHGEKIAVLELEGPIVFGSANSLLLKFDELLNEDINYFILDMKRITDIDSSGAKILEQIYQKLKNMDKSLIISYLDKHGSLWNYLKNLGLFNEINENILFPDTDQALEFYEEKILINEIPDSSIRIRLNNFSVLKGLTQDEINIFLSFLTVKKFNKGETIFAQGDKGDSIYFIRNGLANVTINLDGTKRKKRLQTFSSGTIFGEMAILDNKPRSANVEAGENLECFKLSINDFLELRNKYPRIAYIFLHNITKLLTQRLRNANNTISELEK